MKRIAAMGRSYRLNADCRSNCLLKPAQIAKVYRP